jgi:hypothetical protein
LGGLSHAPVPAEFDRFWRNFDDRLHFSYLELHVISKKIDCALCGALFFPTFEGPHPKIN